MIDQATVERIKDAADIVDVVSEFVSLKKKGANYLGCCPFHDEKTPSFTVSRAKGLYKCFGCGKAGNSVGFIMEHEGMTYPEALKFIAKKYGIEVVEKQLSPKDIQLNDDKESMIILNEFAAGFFKSNLINSDEGRAIGLSYFKERGISPAMIEKFQLGYSPTARKALTQEALKRSYKLEYLEKSGLTIVKVDWQIDRFHSRVMFPIHSLSGKVIGFGGRTLSSDKKTAKYLNSPESEVYNKSKVLYGLYQAKREISNKDECLMVEGYTDVISLHQCGIENVVASSGTSLTNDQIRLVKRYTQNMTVLYDGDAAGIKASLRGIDMILAQDMNVKVVGLPEGEDPDSFSKSMSAQDFKTYIEQHKQDFIKFKTELLLSDVQNDPIKKAEVIKDIVKSISVIPNRITRSVYTQECAVDLGISEAILNGEIANEMQSQRQVQSRRRSTQQPISQDPFMNLPPEAYHSTAFTPAYEPQTVQTATSNQPQKQGFTPSEKSLMKIIIKFANHILYLNEDDIVTEVSVPEYIINQLELDEIEIENPVLSELFEICRGAIYDKQKITQDLFTDSNNEYIKKISIDVLMNAPVESKFWERNGNVVEKEEDLILPIIQKELIAFKRIELKKMIKILDKQIISAQEDEQIISLLTKRNELKQLERIFSKDQGIE